MCAGVYIPPDQAQNLKTDAPEEIGKTVLDSETDCPLPHIIAGDLNVTGRLQEYEEWITTCELWELNDPAVSTQTRGHSIDRILFQPGHYVPSNLLAWFGGERIGEDQPAESANPAEVMVEEQISNHYPAQMFLPSEKPEKARIKYKLVLKDITEEHWLELDE